MKQPEMIWTVEVYRISDNKIIAVKAFNTDNGHHVTDEASRWAWLTVHQQNEPSEYAFHYFYMERYQ